MGNASYFGRVAAVLVLITQYITVSSCDQDSQNVTVDRIVGFPVCYQTWGRNVCTIINLAVLAATGSGASIL